MLQPTILFLLKRPKRTRINEPPSQHPPPLHNHNFSFAVEKDELNKNKKEEEEEEEERSKARKAGPM